MAQWRMEPTPLARGDESQPLKLEICAPCFEEWGRQKGQSTKEGGRG